MHSVTPKECKQRAGSLKSARSSGSKNSRKQQSETIKANIVEDDQFVEIEMQGQNTEFVSDFEQDLNSVQESSDEDEVILNVSSQGNNNATVSNEEQEIVLNKSECSTDEGDDKGLDQQVTKLIEDKIDSSMSKVKDYFEGKFNDLTRVMELEKQLTENKKHLEQLRTIGKNVSVEEDTCSELTIYKNAVERTRGSTSSEDDAIDTSGEDGSESPRLDQVHQIFDLDIPEKELHRRMSFDKDGGQIPLEGQKKSKAVPQPSMSGK